MNIQLCLYVQKQPMCSCFCCLRLKVAKNVFFQVKNVLKNILFFLAIGDSPREAVIQLCISCSLLSWCDIILIEIVLSSECSQEHSFFVVLPECSQEHSFFVKPIFFFFLLRHMLFQFIFKCKAFVQSYDIFHLCPLSKVSSYGET